MDYSTQNDHGTAGDLKVLRKEWTRPTVTVALVSVITASTPLGAENDGDIANAASPYS
jgi:hypothetical protein